jgi:hypothetical protein
MNLAADAAINPTRHDGSSADCYEQQFILELLHTVTTSNCAQHFVTAE